MLTVAPAMLSIPLAASVRLAAAVIVIPSGVMLMALVPAMIWIPASVMLMMLRPDMIWMPAGDMITVGGPAGVGGIGIGTGEVGPDWMVIVGGASLITIWLAGSVRMARSWGRGDGSGGGAIAFHRLPMM